MDFSFEKTNSAYMLFYERCPLNNITDGTSAAIDSVIETHCQTNNNNNQQPLPQQQQPQQQQQQQQQQSNTVAVATTSPTTFELSSELADWIWEDNMHFIQAKNIFEHTYFKYVE